VIRSMLRPQCIVLSGCGPISVLEFPVVNDQELIEFLMKRTEPSQTAKLAPPG
jgi:hypothetical protein